MTDATHCPRCRRANDPLFSLRYRGRQWCIPCFLAGERTRRVELYRATVPLSERALAWLERSEAR